MARQSVIMYVLSHDPVLAIPAHVERQELSVYKQTGKDQAEWNLANF